MWSDGTGYAPAGSAPGAHHVWILGVLGRRKRRVRNEIGSIGGQADLLKFAATRIAGG